MQLNVSDDELIDEPDENTIRSVIAALQEDEFAILVRADQEYVQTYHNDDGTFDVEYRAGSYDKHYAVDSDQIEVADIQDLFVAYLAGRKDWNSGWNWVKIEFDENFQGDDVGGPPEKIAIAHDCYAAEYVGSTADGRQFFLTTPFEPERPDHPGCEYLALFLFDEAGDLLEAKIESLGPRSSVDENYAVQLRDQWLQSLGEIRFERIEVAPFAVERFGTQFGLIPREPEDQDDEWVVEMQPGNYMAFIEPWDSGDYDT